MDDKQWLDDVIVLLDGFNEIFCNGNTNWTIMTKEEKVEWFNDFAIKHAHYIGVDEKWLEEIVVH